MKPSPIPIFNYRKRERHALISDPQKIKNSGSLEDNKSTLASSACGTSAVPGKPSQQTSSDSKSSAAPHNLSASTASYNTHSAYGTNKNNSFREPSSSAWNGKQPLTFTHSNNKPPPSKVPSLMPHKVGINNRRVVTTNSSESQSGFGECNKVNSGTLNSANRNFSNRGPPSKGPMRGPGRARGRGHNQPVTVRGDINQGHRETHSQSSFPHPALSSSSSTSVPQSSSYNGPSGSFQSYTDPRNSFSQWSNKPSPTNNWNSNNNTLNKNNALKLQSGNVHPNFGKSKNRSPGSDGVRRLGQSNTFQNAERSDSFASFNSKTSHSSSIFDEEEVDVQDFTNKEVTKAVPDSSLRIFTCPIKDAQAWSEAQLYDGIVFFEVYGLILSSPMDTASGFGKEFYIRDQSGTMKCVFYEIDRNLPSLLRGQVYRIIGSIGTKQRSSTSGLDLKVVSIRKAEKEERETCKKATEVSLMEMNALAKRLGSGREP